MAGATIEVKFDERRFRGLFREIRDRFRTLRPAMEIVGEIGLASIQRNFETGGRAKWAALKESTIKDRIREKKWPGRILVRKGTAGGLLGSILYRAASNGVTWSSNKIYAATHHFGAEKGSFGTVVARVRGHSRHLASGRIVTVKPHTRAQKLPWGDIPAREFMVLRDEDMGEMEAALAEFLSTGSG